MILVSHTTNACIHLRSIVQYSIYFLHTYGAKSTSLYGIVLQVMGMVYHAYFSLTKIAHVNVQLKEYIKYCWDHSLMQDLITVCLQVWWLRTVVGYSRFLKGFSKFTGGYAFAWILGTVVLLSNVQLADALRHLYPKFGSSC